MKQAEDSRTMELPGLGDDARTWPRRCTLYCRECRATMRGVLVQRYEGPPPCSRCGGLRPGIIEEVPAAVASRTGKSGRRSRGAYAGAVKLGCHGHAVRARTGLSQAEFARHAGVSERSLRTWEAARDPAREAPKVHAAIVAALAALGVGYAKPAARAVRYRCPMTGSTWSGHGLKPRWLVVALDGGARLSDFAV